MIPVVCPVPPWAQKLRGRERVRDLRRRAARAVTRSAELLGRGDFVAEADPDGKPRPFQGMYWSRSHSRRWVAGVVAPHPVGIDVEGLRELGAGARALVGGGPDGLDRWVSLEAAVKCFGVGMPAARRIVIQDGAARLVGSSAGSARLWLESAPSFRLGLAWVGARIPVRLSMHDAEAP